MTGNTVLRRSECDIIGLFPSLGASGGVQASGQLAWEAAARIGRGLPVARTLVSYGTPASIVRVDAADEAFYVASKTTAISLALRRRWSARLVLVWHLGLLKLLPFFRLRRARVALFLHGVEAWQPLDLLTRVLLKRVDLFLTNSNFTWDRFRTQQVIQEPVRHTTVHLGLGSHVEDSTPPPANIPVALMVGRLSRTEDYKGHREVLAAFPRVRLILPEAQLWIVGDGDLRPELEHMATQDGLAKGVRFWGQVTDEQKDQLIGQSRCLALPSRGEGFGLVYLEAMRLGRPCLVSTLDAGREVVDPPHAGLAVNPADESQVADSLARMMTSGPGWDTWSGNAKRRYDTYFTARDFQERLLSAMWPLWNEAAQSARRSAT